MLGLFQRKGGHVVDESHQDEQATSDGQVPKAVGSKGPLTNYHPNAAPAVTHDQLFYIYL